MTPRIGQDFEGECHLTDDEAREVISALVTAASAQARIAELSASMTQQADQWSERLIVMADRAAAAEARADRLAKALEPFASLALDEANDVKGVSMSDPISKWLTVAQLVDARAALQQEG